MKCYQKGPLEPKSFQTKGKETVAATSEVTESVIGQPLGKEKPDEALKGSLGSYVAYMSTKEAAEQAGKDRTMV